LISKVYIVACDHCRNRMEVLKTSSVSGAFRAVRKLKWKTDKNNAVHICVECQAVLKEKKAAAKVKP
jgi:Ribonuclease G/E